MASKSIRKSNRESDYSFRKEFEKALATIPADFSLHQWQHAFKEVIFLMEVKMLQDLGKGGVTLPGFPPPWSIAGGGGHGTPIINVVVAPTISNSPTPSPTTDPKP
jgi:hypothetical protein